LSRAHLGADDGRDGAVWADGPRPSSQLKAISRGCATDSRTSHRPALCAHRPDRERHVELAQSHGAGPLTSFDTSDATADQTALRAADRTAIAALDASESVVSVHPNVTSWWNNASFLLPGLGAVLSLAVGALTRSVEALGFGAFLLAVTLAMLPVVLLTWRRTATSVVLTRERVLALHEGRTLRDIAWSELARIEKSDYDNIKWRLRPKQGDHLSIEAELEDVEGLVEQAARLSGVPPGERPRGAA